jgi:site-specific recombinase XerD
MAGKKLINVAFSEGCFLNVVFRMVGPQTPYMPDQRHHMLFATMWNTGIRIGEARTLTPESFDLDGLRPLFGCCRKKCGHVVAGRQKMKCVWYR